MSILATAGKAFIYNTDGTGRDTYIGFNSGGNTMGNFPTAAAKGGAFRSIEARQYRIAGVGDSAKKLHYQVDGTGRDSYIHINAGGFNAIANKQNSRDAFIASLRSTSYSPQKLQQTIYNSSTKQKRYSPSKDHFIEG